MASPKNLTEQITHLRDRKGGFLAEPIAPEAADRKSTAPPRPQTQKGRPLAGDYFMWSSYALLAAALMTQLCLILWLDIS